jgi:tRNA pseudouridine55 synthase
MNSTVSTPEGVLFVDKPMGMTSHDVVNRIRRFYNLKKVGHAGTLDPMATGLLIMLIGKATKVSQYLMSLNKEYEGTITFGVETDSFDAEGEVVAQMPVPEMDDAAIDAALKSFHGDQYQLPPMFSAKKIGGQPLYKSARKGIEVEREPRFIHVARFDRLGWQSPDLNFRLRSSKGTYVRSIAHDLGERLKTCAHLSALRRTMIDEFSVKDAFTLEQIEEMSTGNRMRALQPVYKVVPSPLLG